MAYPTEPTIEIEDLAPRATLGGYHARWQESGMIAHAYLEPIEDQPARGYILETTYQTMSGRDPGPRQRDQGARLTAKLREQMTTCMIDAGWQPIPVPGISGLAWQHESRLRAQGLVKQGDLVIPKKVAPVKEARQVDEMIVAHQAEQKAARQVEQGNKKKKRELTKYDRTVAVEKLEQHKASMAARGWTFERTEPIGNGCETHVWAYYRKQNTSELAAQDIPKKQKTLLVAARSGEDRRNIKGYKRTITATPVTFTCERCQSEATRTVYPGKRPQYCDACAVEVKREKTRARVARLRAGQKTT